MNVHDAEAALASLDTSSSDADVEVGIGGRPPHHYAYLKLTSRSDPKDFAIVSTPGDRWFTVEVAGNFAHNEFSEENDDAEVRRILQNYLSAGIAYLHGQRRFEKTRFLRVPYVVVETVAGPLKLIPPGVLMKV